MDYWNSTTASAFQETANSTSDIFFSGNNGSTFTAAGVVGIWPSSLESLPTLPTTTILTTTPSSSTISDVNVPSFFNNRGRYSATETLILVIVLGFLTAGTIVGNILVCVAVCLVRKLRKPSNYLLVSLAVSDLCVAVLVMPMAAVYELSGAWPLGRILCDMWVAWDVLACAASILNLCMISVDRYFAITKPLKYGVKRTPKRMLIYIAVVWLGAAAISIPPPVILGNEHGTEAKRECLVCQNFWYQILATLGSFYIPLIVMIVVYARIFKAAKRITDEEKKSQLYMKSRNSIVAASFDAVVRNRVIENNHAVAAVVSVTSEKAVMRNGSARKASYSSNLLQTSASAPAMGVHSSSDSDDDSRRCSDSSGKFITNCSGVIGFSPAKHTKSLVIASAASNVRTGHGGGSGSSASGTAGGGGMKMKLFLSSERKASATLGIIMSAFVICWLPFFVLAVIRPFAHEDAIPHALTSFFLWLGYANSFLNPVIYATLNKDFRTPFREILCFRCRSLQVMMREEFYHSQYGEPEAEPRRRHYSCGRGSPTSQHQIHHQNPETARLTAFLPNETVL